MCDFSGKLIAWMDRELPESEAADLERHLAACAECRERLGAYERTSSAFKAYCEATFAAETRQKLPRRLRAAGVAAGIAAAAAFAALLVLPDHRVAQVPPGAPPVAEAPPLAARAEARPGAEGARPADSAAARVNATTGPPIRRSRRQYASAGWESNHDSQGASATEPSVQASRARNISPFPAEPPIQISIPADAMFPPGAVPLGTSFTAELTISADGSAERLGLRPQFAGFERRANQP